MRQIQFSKCHNIRSLLEIALEIQELRHCQVRSASVLCPWCFVLVCGQSGQQKHAECPRLMPIIHGAATDRLRHVPDDPDPPRIHHVSSRMKTCSRLTPSHPGHFKQFKMSGAASGSYPSHPGSGRFTTDYHDPVPIGYRSFPSHPGSRSGVERGDPGLGVTVA